MAGWVKVKETQIDQNWGGFFPCAVVSSAWCRCVFCMMPLCQSNWAATRFFSTTGRSRRVVWVRVSMCTHASTCVSMYSLESNKESAHSAVSLRAFVMSLSHFLVPSLQRAYGTVRLTSLRCQSSVEFAWSRSTESAPIWGKAKMEKSHTHSHTVVTDVSFL